MNAPYTGNNQLSWAEHLALLFVEKQDISSKTPAEVYKLYMNALNEIKAAHTKR